MDKILANHHDAIKYFIQQNDKNNKSNVLHRITTLYTIFQQIFLLENTLVFSFR